jgi:hypothetical protein
MLFERHQEAAKVFQPEVRVVYPAPPARAAQPLQRATARGARPLGPHASLPTRAGALGRELFPPRCRERACVFPALPGGGECVYHRRQSLEPGCFQSQQPSCLLLDQARFGLPDSEPDDERVRDRHRLAAERVRFLLGEAA